MASDHHLSHGCTREQCLHPAPVSRQGATHSRHRQQLHLKAKIIGGMYMYLTNSVRCMYNQKGMLGLVSTGHFAGLPRQLEAQAEQIPLVRNISLIGNLTIKGFVFSLVFMLSWGRCTGSQTCCCVCWDVYDPQAPARQPRTLPCGHTACTGCLRKSSQRNY